MTTAISEVPVTSAPTVRRPLARSPVVLVLGRASVLVALAVAWWWGSRVSDLVPSIAGTVEAFGDGFAEGQFQADLRDSLTAVLAGFTAAVALAVPLGVLLGRSRYWGAAIEPLITGAFAIPRIIVYPVLLAFFGVGWMPKLWMAAVSAFFPVVLMSIGGIRNVDPILLKLGASMNCTRRQLFGKILLPAAAPSIMSGIRIGFAVSFISVIIAEFFAARQGLGLLIREYYGFQELPSMFAVVILVTVIALAGNMLLWGLERRIRAATD